MNAEVAVKTLVKGLRRLFFSYFLFNFSVLCGSMKKLFQFRDVVDSPIGLEGF